MTKNDISIINVMQYALHDKEQTNFNFNFAQLTHDVASNALLI